MVAWEFLTVKDENVLVKIAVKPNSRKKNIIVDSKENFLFVDLLAPPDKGKANKELLKFLSNFLDISLSRFQISSGHTTRNKIVLIKNVTKEEIKVKLQIESRKE